MFSVNPIKTIDTNFNKVKLNQQNTKKHQNTQQNTPNSTKLLGYEFYSDITFKNRRKPLTLEEKFLSLKPEEFPPKRIVDNIEKAIEDPDNNKTLYQIHMETYAPLLECKTLDEAKALFPEFDGVIDAKELFLTYGTREDKEQAFKSAPYIAQKVFAKEVPEISIDDLSLDLLKKIYGKAYATSSKDKFYGFNHSTIVRTLEALNIERLDIHYRMMVNGDNPDMRTTRKVKVKEMWNEDTPAARTRKENARENGYIWWETRTDEEKAQIIKRLRDLNERAKK